MSEENYTVCRRLRRLAVDYRTTIRINGLKLAEAERRLDAAERTLSDLRQSLAAAQQSSIASSLTGALDDIIGRRRRGGAEAEALLKLDAEQRVEAWREAVRTQVQIVFLLTAGRDRLAKAVSDAEGPLPITLQQMERRNCHRYRGANVLSNRRNGDDPTSWPHRPFTSPMLTAA